MITRRTFLAQATTLAAASLHADEPPSIIDTHTHFYDPTRPQGVPWPAPTEQQLYRTVLPPDFRKLAEPLGIRGTIVVEASPWVEDNQWLLDLAAREPFILGIVGNLDPLAPDFPAHIARFAKNPKYRGIRVSGQQFIERGKDAPYRDSIKRLADAGLSLDFNGPAAYLPHIPALHRAVPGQRIIIDHVGSAGDPQALTQEWRDGIRAAGENETVFCKISALAEQSKCAPGKAPTHTDYYLPILDPVWAAFGEKRVIFGSNWPVSDRGTTLDKVLAIVSPYFAEKGATKRYFTENSRDAYRY